MSRKLSLPSTLCTTQWADMGLLSDQVLPNLSDWSSHWFCRYTAAKSFLQEGSNNPHQGPWTLLKIIVYADNTQASEDLTGPSTNDTLGEKKKGVTASFQSTCLFGEEGCFCGEPHVLQPVIAQHWWEGIWCRVVVFLGWVLWVALWVVTSCITAFGLCLTMHQLARQLILSLFHPLFTCYILPKGIQRTTCWLCFQTSVRSNAIATSAAACDQL